MAGVIASLNLLHQSFDEPNSSKSKMETQIKEEDNNESGSCKLPCSITSKAKQQSITRRKSEEKYYHGGNTAFVSRVLWKELGFEGGTFKLLVAVVHGVLLEYGFIGFDPSSGTLVDRLLIPEEWPSSTTCEDLRFTYTLSEFLQANQDDHSSSLKVTSDLTVVLQFQKIKNYCCLVSSPWRSTVSSKCSRPKTYHYRAELLVGICRAGIDFLCNVNKSSCTEWQALDMLNTVKDKLAVPLSVSLRAKAGLRGPPFIDLPRHLQLRILELLPAADIAKLGCVSRALNLLSRDNDLWKKKFIDKFGSDWRKIFFHVFRTRFVCVDPPPPPNYRRKLNFRR